MVLVVRGQLTGEGEIFGDFGSESGQQWLVDAIGPKDINVGSHNFCERGALLLHSMGRTGPGALVQALT